MRIFLYISLFRRNDYILSLKNKRTDQIFLPARLKNYLLETETHVSVKIIRPEKFKCMKKIYIKSMLLGNFYDTRYKNEDPRA